MSARLIVAAHAQPCPHRGTRDMRAAPGIRRRDQVDNERTGPESPDLRSHGLTLDRPDEPIGVVAVVGQAAEDSRKRCVAE